ncbi:MAG: exodeoxyribonuclease VII large subunit [Flavobacteriales bacterium]
MEPRRHYSLHQLCSSIRKRLEEATGGRRFWVRAEIAGVNVNRHMYLDLVEHQQGQRVAVLRAVVWNTSLGVIREALGAEFGNILKQGAEVLLCGTVHFSEVYGLSLHVEEVDLSFSLGELERRKQATIATLRKEGLFDLNRALPEPMVVQRIALVASIGSAAYADFMQHLSANEYGYRFHVHEYPSAVQGDDAPRQLRAALAAIDPARYDAVVVIRGGGSKLDLEAFNDLDLCRAIARMPIPVMTGIGHDVDVSVMDMLAKSPHKTPTAIADHLVDKCVFFETSLSGFLVGMQRVLGERSSRQKQRLATHVEALRTRPRMLYERRRSALQQEGAAIGQHALNACRTATELLNERYTLLATLPLQRLQLVEAVRVQAHQARLHQYAQRGLRTLAAHLEGMQRTVQLLAPERMLARGFSITRHAGHAITAVDGLSLGQEIETTFSNGTTTSIIQRIEHHD